MEAIPFIVIYIQSYVIRLNHTHRQLLIKILLSGVNIINPGSLCSECGTRGKKNQQALLCNKCNNISHRTCLGIDQQDYKFLTQNGLTCRKCILLPVQQKCGLCSKVDRRRNILCCYDCKQYFHVKCIKDANKNFQTTNFVWKCDKCEAKTDNECSLINTTNIEDSEHSIPTKGISIGHINVREMMSTTKKDYIASFLQRTNLHILGISETWLHSDTCTSESYIGGYIIARLDRPNVKSYKTQGGGLLLYVSDCYYYYEFEEIRTKDPTSTEILHILVTKTYIKPIHIILVYKKPTENISSLTESLRAHLQLCNDDEVYVMGDFNVNVLKYTNDTKQLINLMSEFNHKQLIKKPTRTTMNSATLIDCIFTNRPNINLHQDIIPVDISDHDFVYTVRKKPKSFRSPVKRIQVRCFKYTYIAKMRAMVSTAPWWIFDYCKSANEKFTVFHKTIKHILDVHAPLRTITAKAKKNKWISTEYETICKTVERARKKYKITRNPGDFAAYKVIRNKANRMKAKLPSTKPSNPLLPNQRTNQKRHAKFSISKLEEERYQQKYQL